MGTPSFASAPPSSPSPLPSLRTGSPCDEASRASNPYELIAMGASLFFTADDGSQGRGLWRSNGTEAGTVLVRDIWGGTNSSNPDSFENVNGTLFFTASNGVNGNELWKSNGTSAGTVMVKDIWPGSSGWGSDLTHVGNIVYFGANDGINARLW